MSKIQIKEVAIPTENPPAGKFFLAIDVADSALYIKDSSGTVTKFAGITASGIYGGSGTVPTSVAATLTDTLTFSGDNKSIVFEAGGSSITLKAATESILASFVLKACKLGISLECEDVPINNAKNIQIGTTFTGASGDGVLSIGVGTPPSTDQTDTVQVFTENGRDFTFRDETGAQTNLAQNASETVPGRVELATQAEVDAGVDTSRVVTPATLQQKIADNVAGLYDHKGAYDAATNTPDLDTSPSGILKGDAYTVSVAGTFFTEELEVGDVIIADQDSPTLLSHWTRVQKNVDQATTTTKGIVELATTAEVDTGTDTDRAITPDALNGSAPTIVGTNFSAIPNGALSTNPLARANHTGTQLLSTISDVTATAAEVNLLDLSGLTAGWVLSADSATTASWKAPTSGVITGSVATTDATVTTIDTIDTFTAEASHTIRVVISCKSDDDAKYGSWINHLTVTKIAGTVVVRNNTSSYHHSPSGLNAGSVTFVVNAGNLDIKVQGIAATNIQWDSTYEILSKSTN